MHGLIIVIISVTVFCTQDRVGGGNRKGLWWQCPFKPEARNSLRNLFGSWTCFLRHICARRKLPSPYMETCSTCASRGSSYTKAMKRWTEQQDRGHFLAECLSAAVVCGQADRNVTTSVKLKQRWGNGTQRGRFFFNFYHQYSETDARKKKGHSVTDSVDSFPRVLPTWDDFCGLTEHGSNYPVTVICPYRLHRVQAGIRIAALRLCACSSSCERGDDGHEYWIEPVGVRLHFSLRAYHEVSSSAV